MRFATWSVLTDATTVNGRARRELEDARRRRLPGVVRPAHRTRHLGRAPGWPAMIALPVLAAVGVKATIAPRPASITAPAPVANDARDITVQGFAQAYLSRDCASSAARRGTERLSDVPQKDSSAGGVPRPIRLFRAAFRGARPRAAGPAAAIRAVCGAV